MTRPTYIWDPAVRVLHWTLASSTIFASWTAIAGYWSAKHEPAGYVAAAALALRCVWGVIGTRHARFSEFVRTPRETFIYVRSLLAGGALHYQGHNPLGGWMVVALLASASGAVSTGWLFTTDAFWGSESVALAHAIFAYLLLILIVLHIAGVLTMSACRRQNLLRAMITGRR
ncbi:MAG TPA: cytochrome b/b6 domain-containing protein [Steroidobacter sp.]|nr:cytochrome b/b6 domain-containing protein [Steroidobacter sp.]